MADLIGKLSNVSLSYATGKPLMTFELDGDKQTILKAIDELSPCDRLTIKVGKFRKKRSLDANAYCWTLISKLAEKLGIPKTDIYRAAIRDIGGNSDIVCLQNKAVKAFCDGWEGSGLGWLTETFPSKLDGCTNVTIYYGSSTYDSAQMSRLISIIQEDCRLQGIETKSEEEVASLLERWEK